MHSFIIKLNPYFKLMILLSVIIYFLKFIEENFKIKYF
jgi:hypothetical protein